MALPNLNNAGELSIGIHQATIDEVIAQFGSGTLQREIVTKRLQRIYQLAKDTSNFQQLIILGSYSEIYKDFDTFVVQTATLRTLLHKQESLCYVNPV